MTLFSNSSTWQTNEHKLFSQSVRKFYETEMVPHIEKWNDSGIVDRVFWQKAGHSGIMGGSVSEEYGGSGGDIGFDSVALYEQARTGDASWGYGIQSIVIHYLTAYGSQQQKTKWLPKLVSGEKIGALAMTEPGTGSDVQSIRTTAEKDGNQYLINGPESLNYGSTRSETSTTKNRGECGEGGAAALCPSPKSFFAIRAFKRRTARFNSLHIYDYIRTDWY